MRRLGSPHQIVNYTINLDLGTPEPMGDILTRRERCKVQPTPAVQTNSAQQTQRAAGLVFPVWPQFCDANRKFGIG
jgi:hypothetical protein